MTQMRFGVCTGPENVAAVQAAGFDYVEFGLAGHLTPWAPDAEALPPLAAALAATSLRVEAVNGMLPAEMRIVGADVKWEAVQTYLSRAAARTAWIGADTVVFGSGAARRVPGGFARDVAEDQIADFLTRAGDVFGRAGITVAIEPLNISECNILNSVTEAAAMASRVAHPHVCVLSDLYHVGHDGQDFAETAAAGPLLAHVHVARPSDRHAPAQADLELMTGYFAALRQARYERRVSIEGVWQETPGQAEESLHVLRAAWERSGETV